MQRTPELTSNEARVCMRVDRREFAWEFHQLSCPGQTRTRVAWELTSESLHENFINSRVLVKREQELHESWQARVCMRVSSTLVSWSNENKGFWWVSQVISVTLSEHLVSCLSNQVSILTTSIEYNAFIIVSSNMLPHMSCSPGLWGDIGIGYWQLGILSLKRNNVNPRLTYQYINVHVFPCTFLYGQWIYMVLLSESFREEVSIYLLKQKLHLTD